MKILKWAGVCLLSLSVLGVACSSNTSKKTDAQNDANAQLSMQPSDQETLRVLSKTYTASQSIWEGFDVMDHPSIVVFRNAERKARAIIAINFPQLSALGEVEAIDTEGAPFTAVQVKRASADLTAEIAKLGYFEFMGNIGGVSTYLIAADDNDASMDSTTPDFGLLYVHEMFHRYQMQTFKVSQADQRLDTYPFSADNLLLALLEENALNAALEAETDENRLAASRHFAALRVERRAREARVALDDSQESYEGTARYLEHKIAGDNASLINHEGNFASNLITGESERMVSVKSHFGFARFYASGAAIVELIRRFGVADFYDTIEKGTAVPTVLINHVGMSDGDKDVLADALSTYDPSGELKLLAEKLAEKAKTESDDFHSGGSDSPPGDGEALTQEQVDCLKDEGIDTTGDTMLAIPDDVVKKCLS